MKLYTVQNKHGRFWWEGPFGQFDWFEIPQISQVSIKEDDAIYRRINIERLYPEYEGKLKVCELTVTW